MTEPVFKLDIPQIASPTPIPNLNFDPMAGLQSFDTSQYAGMGKLMPFDTSGYAGMMKPGAPAAAPSIWSNFLQTKNADGSTTGGWGSAALGVFSGLSNAWLGMKQYGLAKDALKESKRQFDLDYTAQKNAYNESLETRQITRNRATNGQVFDSVEDTMKKYGVK